MRPDALTEQNAQTWTSGQLGQVLDRHASQGLVDNAPLPAPEPPEDIPPRTVSLAEELAGSSDQLTARGVQALMSNTRHVANKSFSTDGETREKEEEEKLKNFRNNHIFISSEKFNIGGIEMTAREASDNLHSAQKRLLKTQEANTEAARVNITKEEFKELSKVDDTCMMVDGRAIEDVTLVDGFFVETDLYHEMEIQNQELAQQYEQAQIFSAQVEAGHVTWDQAPDDIINLVAEEHKLRTEGPQETLEDPTTVLEKLQDMQTEIQATMQPVTTVQPVVTYAQMSPG